jgi:competence protein ComEC
MSDESEPSRKVCMAPLAPLAIAASAGVVLDRFLEPWGTSTWGLLALVGAGVAAIAWRSPRLSIGAIAAAFLAIAGGWHHHQWSDLEADDPARAEWASGDRRPSWVRGMVVEGATFRKGNEGPGDRGSTRAIVALTGINEGRGWHPASGRVQTWIAGDRSDLEAGRAIEAAGALSAIEGPLNPGELDLRPILRARGIRLRLAVDEPTGVWSDPLGEDWPRTRWLGAIRAWSARKLASGLDPAVAPLASALLLGRREAVDPEVNDAFARTGTTHLLAISGLHLQVLAVVLGACVRASGVGRKGTFVVVGLGTVAYALLVGWAPSVVRSAAMTCGACLAGWKDRCVGPANLLAGAALMTLLFNPSDLFDVGCQLSFLAVAAILWCVPPVLAWDAPVLRPLDVLERRLEPWWRFLGRVGLTGIRDGMKASAVIWLVGWPLVALRFHLVSPVGILINLPLIPLTSLALLLAGMTLALSAVWAPLGVPFAWACGRSLGWTETVVRWGTAWRWGHAFVPGPPWAWVLAFYALVGLATMAAAARWRSSRRWWGLAIVCGAIGTVLPMVPSRPIATEAEVLAVGHGLSVVIRSGEGKTVLYDCGRMGDPHVGRRMIAPALWSRGVRRIDIIILSHADSDHFNGLPDLLDRFEITTVHVPPGFGGPANPGAKQLLDDVRARGIPVSEIARGDRIELGGGTVLGVLHPRRDSPASSTDNARSVVLEVASGGRRLLLTGDLERDGLTDLVALPPLDPLGAMLAPHHGGRTSNPPWLYEWAKPELVVVSQRPQAIGPRDPLATLSEGHFPLLRTWQAGAIRLLWSPEGLVASGFLDRPGLRPEPGDGGPLANSDGSTPADAPGVRPLPGWIKAVATILGLAAGAALCLLVTVAEWGAWSLVMPGRRPPSKDPGEWPGLPIEATAPDGVRLAGTWFPSPVPSGRVLLLLHGLAEDRSALLGRAPALNRRGWGVAVLDARASGESGGRRGSMGGREADDIRAWLDALTGLAGPDPDFAAWGRSMGASTALKAAAIDPRIAALVLEAPYLDLASAVAAVLRRLRLPGVLARLVLLRARMLAGVALDRPRPIDLAPRVHAPTLILHGTEDPIAPIAGARTLAAAFPRPAEVLEVAEAGHANVVGLGGDPLMDRVGAFLDAIPPRGR